MAKCKLKWQNACYISVKTVSPTESAYQSAESYLVPSNLSFSSKLGDKTFSVKNDQHPVQELEATYAVEESQASSIGNMAWAVCYQSCSLSRHCFHNTNRQPRSWALSSPLGSLHEDRLVWQSARSWKTPREDMFLSPTDFQSVD